MKTKRTIKELFNSARQSLGYAVEGVIIDFTEQVIARLDALQINRVKFAEKIESSPAYVTKLLRGDTNFTLESMVKVARALDSEIRVELVPKVPVNVWIEIAEKKLPVRTAEALAWVETQNRRIQPESTDGSVQVFSCSLQSQEEYALVT
jgi:transcriptional regulator with XRE-family HTH domain